MWQSTRMSILIKKQEIHNYLFFGNVQELLDTIKERVNIDDGDIKFLILNFNNVIGIDSSAWEGSLYHTKWLQAIGPGNTAGEFSFYFKKPRRASLLAAEDCVVYMHTYADRKQLLNNDKSLALYINELIICNLSELLAHGCGR